MNNERLYIDFHIIQTVPPSCVNRDDTGRPKTAFYGGVNRARVSSQSWKHAMRTMFTDIFSDEKLGFRTKNAVKLIEDSLKKISPDITDEKAQKSASEALVNAGIKVNEKKGNTTGALFFISKVQAEKLAQLIANGEKEKKAYKEALQSSPSVDIALFGRMVADDVNLNVDAASQVAHSISTHAVQNEYDYFTAVDDFSEENHAGAGHLGTMEFNSATLYRYATVNITDLLKTLGKESTADAIKGFAESFICSMPAGKQNSYANRTLPDMVYVTIRNNQPVNLCGAFEKPVSSYKGYTEKSISELSDYAEKIYDNYCGSPVKSYVIGRNSFIDAEKVNLNQLLDVLHKYIVDEVV
ncbi:MAG: type I-E CRISPR-associated protein Cas7/Cse4/CasC [Prevotella sp.]|nr:type I-E CRISPR-associated protein Cas7/Cse4/CasC [Alistipes senegalensis]MCM1357982.1 type I-E CRISPR-associated protein Cas7/Cse4/CasC [Prevotella sp.]